MSGFSHQSLLTNHCGVSLSTGNVQCVGMSCANVQLAASNCACDGYGGFERMEARPRGVRKALSADNLIIV